jgi:uncharacterized alpha-E superfamily protein
MLSRVAESLYWTARYVERAEDTTRLLHTHFHGLLDSDLPDRGQAWRELVLLFGRDDLFLEHFEEYTAATVTEFLLWHPSNPDAVSACIARARENARGVREQISSEMWEHLNRLHLRVSRSRGSAILAAPHDFFVRIRDGSHAFCGVTKATLSRGEAYEFLELGAHLERADFTTRFLLLRAPELRGASESALTQLLKSCGSWEAFRKQERGELQPERVLAFLLLERSYPRAVAFCLELALAAIRAISGSSVQPERAIGRVFAALSFAELPALDSETTDLLRRVRQGIDDAAAEIADAYFTTRVILPGPYAQQQQQQ